MKTFIFPGQGSQAVGMGKALYDAFPEAKEVFQEVDDTLGQKLSKLMFEGPQDELTSTENAQPALMTASIAVIRVLEKQGGINLSDHIAFVAGHSLGEYSALCAAKTFSLKDTANLLRTRGNAMQAAVPKGQGGMAAVIGVDIDTAQSIVTDAAEADTLEIANDNAPGQIVISGSLGAIARAEAIAKEKGAKKYVQLPVSAPFHCSLIQPAADVMQGALDAVAISAPIVPLMANVTAEITSDPEAIKAQLVEQVTGRVRWTESMQHLSEKGVTEVVEIGTGKVLSGLMRRINRDIATSNLETPEDIEAYLNA